MENPSLTNLELSVITLDETPHAVSQINDQTTALFNTRGDKGRLAGIIRIHLDCMPYVKGYAQSNEGAHASYELDGKSNSTVLFRDCGSQTVCDDCPIWQDYETIKKPLLEGIMAQKMEVDSQRTTNAFSTALLFTTGIFQRIGRILNPNSAYPILPDLSEMINAQTNLADKFNNLHKFQLFFTRELTYRKTSTSSSE